MNRIAFAVLATLALLAPAGLAQDTFTFETDFEAGQVYRYEVVSTASLDDMENVSRTEVEYAYEILDADEETFTVRARIDRLAFESPQMEFVYPETEIPVAMRPFLLGLRAIEAIRFTYDRNWNIVRVSGLGRLIGRLFRPLPDPLDDLGRELGRLAENVLGPLATAAFQGSNEGNAAHRLFEMGTVRVGDSWKTETELPLFGTTGESWRVAEFATAHDRPVCRIATTQELRYGELMTLLGYGNQTTEGTLTLFSNGLPASANLESRMTFQGRTVVTRIETALASEGARGDEGLDVWERIQTALESGDFDGALATLGRILEDDPSHGDAWLARAEVLQTKAFQVSDQGRTTEASARLFLESAAAFRRHAELVAEDEVDDERAQIFFYNEACGHAILGAPEEAIASLRQAIEAGWTDAEHLSTDPDLETLREREDFRTLLAELQGKAEESIATEIDELFEAHEPFDFTFELTDIEGETRKLSDSAGKVLIVDFWGTWCPPCRREIPHFVALHSKYRAAGLDIVGINYEGVPDEEARETIAEFAKEHGITYPCLLGDDATQERVPGFQGYPTTLFIDRTGKVRLVLVGYHDLAVLEAIVERLLDEKQD